MTLRNFRPADLNRLLDIWLSSNLSAHAFIPADYWHGKLPMVREALPTARLLVCTREEDIAGFAGVLEAGYIAGIFVDAAHRNAGVGTRLIASLQAEYPSLTLSVYTRNAGALRFYRRLGFREVASQLDAATGQPEALLRWEAP